MKQTLVSSQSLDTFPSPGNYNGKGWSSERVPHPSGSSGRHVSALTPFNSGRALPSKWEDAERWICSPVLGYGTVAKNNSSRSQPQRRRKSKSGPILPPPPRVIGCYSNFSPSMQALDAGTVKNCVVNSPFSTGVLMPNRIGVHYNGGHDDVARSGRVLHGWSDLVSQSSSPSTQDDKLDYGNDEEHAVSCVISRRDMATQMSSEASTHSSPRKRSSPSIPPAAESPGDQPAKLDIREVQVDKRATIISWSKRHGSRIIKMGVPGVEDFTQNARDAHTSNWDISEEASDFSKLQREEAKISAWENLQKAKAEAAIRKLEMKLEKKKSASMDKIFSKLRLAQMKAEDMRSSISVRQDHQLPKKLHEDTFSYKHTRLSSFRSCFTCHAV